MKVLNFNPIELKQAIDKDILISEAGFEGAIFLHGKDLIKLHKELYHYLKINSEMFAQRVFERIYQWDKRPFVKPEQIEFLQSKQKNIHLTDFDQGIVKVEDQICGTILTPHLDYHDLTNINAEDLQDTKILLEILANILAALRELEKNEISHLDLALAEAHQEPSLNILYKNTDIKLCDLSGRFITYGENFDGKEMYRQYATVIKVLINKLCRLNPIYKQIFNNLNLSNLTTYDQACSTLDIISKKLKK